VALLPSHRGEKLLLGRHDLQRFGGTGLTVPVAVGVPVGAGMDVASRLRALGGLTGVLRGASEGFFIVGLLPTGGPRDVPVSAISDLFLGHVLRSVMLPAPVSSVEPLLWYRERLPRNASHGGAVKAAPP